MGKKNNSGGGLGLNKFSFWLLVVIALLYLVSMILNLLGIFSHIVGWMQAGAGLLATLIVAILAWRYVAGKPPVWIVLYFIAFLVVLVCIILPQIRGMF